MENESSIKSTLTDVVELKKKLTAIEAEIETKQSVLMHLLDEEQLKAYDQEGSEVKIVERTSYDPHYTDEHNDEIEKIKQELKTKKAEIELSLQKDGKEKEVVSRYLKVVWKADIL